MSIINLGKIRRNRSYSRKIFSIEKTITHKKELLIKISLQHSVLMYLAIKKGSSDQICIS